MLPGLEIKYSLNDEPAKIYVVAWNDDTKAKTECWIYYTLLEQFAEHLKNRPTSSTDIPFFGEWSDTRSSVLVSFEALNRYGHILAVIRISTGDYEPYRSEATIRFLSDAASLDEFAGQLLSAIATGSGISILKGFK